MPLAWRGLLKRGMDGFMRFFGIAAGLICFCSPVCLSGEVPEDVAEAYGKAQAYLYVNEDSCALFCELVYDYAVRHDATELEADVLLLKAETLFYKGDVDAVMEICATVREMAQRSGNRILLVQSLVLQGRSYMDMDCFDKAYSALSSAQDMASDMGDSTLLAKICNSFGVLYDLQHQEDVALDFYYRGLEFAASSKDPLLPVRFLNNIAIIYTAQGRFDEAKSILFDCIARVREKGMAFGLDRLYMNIVPVYISLGQVDSALSYVDKSLAIAAGTGNSSSMARSLIYKGYIYYMEKDWAMADEAFALADSLIMPLGFDNMHCMILRYRAWVAEGEGCFEDAYRFLEAYMQKSDSLESKRNVANMMRMQMDAEAEHAEMEAGYRIYRLGLMFVSMVLLLLLLGAWFWYRSRQQRQRLLDAEGEKRSLESDLEQENKKWITQSLYRQKKEHDLTEVVERLRVSKPYFKVSNQPLIEHVINTLEKCVTEEPWTAFEARFEKVHMQFFKNLGKVYPDLTVNEKRLCAYLRLNMTTKEIASMTHSSPRAVEQARYRLRKRLGLGREDDLGNFLARFDEDAEAGQ